MTNRTKEQVLERSFSEEAKLELVTKVVAGLLIDPNRFAIALNEQGVSVRPEEPLGIISLESLQREFIYAGIQRNKGGRTLATETFQQLKKGYTFGLFPNFKTHMRVYKVNGDEFYYRDDLGISPEILHQRHVAYVELLNAEIEARRPKVLQSPTVYTPTRRAPLYVISDFGQEYVDGKLENLKALGMEPVLFGQLSSALPNTLLKKGDIQAFLKNGIAPSVLAKIVIPALQDKRAAIAHDYEEVVETIAPKIIEKVKEYETESSRHIPYIVVPAPHMRRLLSLMKDQGLSDQQPVLVSEEKPNGLALGYPLWFVCRILDNIPIEESSFYSALLAEAIGSLYINVASLDGLKQQIALQHLRRIADDLAPEAFGLIFRSPSKHQRPSDRLDKALSQRIPSDQPKLEDYGLRSDDYIHDKELYDSFAFIKSPK